MQYRAFVPEGVKPGQVVKVNADGADLSVRIPRGVSAGDAFLFEVSKDEIKAGQSAEIRNSKSDKVISPFPAGSSSYRKRPILGILTRSDLIMACILGFAIFLSILFGFILGILYSTKPLDCQAKQVERPALQEVLLQSGKQTRVVTSLGGQKTRIEVATKDS